MYTPTANVNGDALNGSALEPFSDETEQVVLRVLTELEELPSDVQSAVYARLLTGLANKLTSAVATKAISAAKVEGIPAKQKISGSKRRAGHTAQAQDVPRPDSQLRHLTDPADPIEAWQRFGGSAAEVFDVLRQEPTGVLEAMLNHRNMPPGPKPRGKSREKLAEAISVRLEQRFRGY